MTNIKINKKTKIQIKYFVKNQLPKNYLKKIKLKKFLIKIKKSNLA